MSKLTDQAVSLHFNFPNVITVVRVVLTAAIAWLLIQGGAARNPLAGILLIVAWATDGLDGFLARRLGQSTLGGALFDLVADRLLMTSILMAGIFTYMWKRRNRAIDFPPPTQVARITYSVQMLTLVVAVLGIGPDMLLAALMYLTIIFTLLASYSYLKRGGYVFTC